jgi:hypothetical protein
MTQSSESPLILNKSETLFRQVHPTQFPNGQPSSEAFVPSEQDKFLLSTMREIVGPEEAHRRWTEDMEMQSVGTFGISVGEINEQGLTAVDDAEATSQPDHASVDFSSITSKGARKRIGRRLRDAAVSRGCLFQP